MSAAGKNDDALRHLGEYMQKLLLIISGNKEWHSDLGGMKRVTSEKEKLQLIEEGYSFVLE